MQKKEANHVFADFIEDNYLDWMSGNDTPVMIHQVLNKNKRKKEENKFKISFC